MCKRKSNNRIKPVTMENQLKATELIEEWKDIDDFPGYLISNFGRVKTKSRPIRYVHSITQKEHFRMSTERFIKVHHNNITS